MHIQCDVFCFHEERDVRMRKGDFSQTGRDSRADTSLGATVEISSFSYQIIRRDL